MAAISLNQQIEEAQQVLARYQTDFPVAVARGRMRQGEADYHIDRQRAVVATLVWLRAKEPLIRQRLAS